MHFSSDEGQIFLIGAQQAQGGEQGVGGHTGRQAERYGKDVAAGGAVVLARQAVDIEVGFGQRVFQGARHGGTVLVGLEQVVEQLLLHALDPQRSLGGGGGFALFLAFDLGYVELDEAVGGNSACDMGADELACAVAVGEQDDGAFLGQRANEGELFLMVEHAKAIGGDDLTVHDALQALLVVAALDDDGVWDIEFLCHG